MEKETLSVTLGEVINQMQTLNSKLDSVNKTMDASKNSSTSMNTGFLAMNEAVKNLGSTLPSLTSAFNVYKTAQLQVNSACQAFAANPVGATIQIISTALAVINVIIDKFKERIAQSDEATAKWNKALAALDPILKMFNSVLDVIVDKFIDIVGVITKGVEYVGKFGDAVSKFFGGSGEAYTKAAGDAKKYAKLQDDINKQERQRIKDRAASEARQGKLREQISTAEGEAKRKLLKDLADEIKAQTNAEIALNKKRIALMKYQQSLGPTSAAEKKQLAELEAQTDKLIGEQGRQLAKINKQMNSVTTSSAKHTTKTVKDATDTAIKEAQRYAKERNAILTKSNKDFSQDTALLSAIRKQEDARNKLEGKSNSELLAIKENRLNEDIAREQAHYDKQKELLTKSLESGKLSIEDATKYREQLRDLEIEHEINGYKYSTEQLTLENEKKLQLSKDFADAIKEHENAKKEEEEDKEHELEIYLEHIQDINEVFNNTFDLIEDRFDKLSEPQQRLIQGFEDIKDTILTLPKDMKPAEKAMTVLGKAMNSAISIINSYMSAKQQQIQADLKAGKITQEEAEEQFESTKKVQIAMATISMLQGIVEAIAGAMTLGPILGPIIGGINSALVATAGALQISAIKSTTLDNPGDSNVSIPRGFDTGVASYAAAAPLLNEEFDLAQMGTTTTTQGDSATTDQRVYILESDIQESNKRVEVREDMTSF